METIRNYLDTMFANLPNTPSVLRARDELWQMMEDKYSELIAEGRSENEAVGTVIAEFGNLSELADALGLTEEINEQVQEEAESPKRMIALDEAKAYLRVKSDSAFKLSLGIALCIMSIAVVILSSYLFPITLQGLCPALMFTVIAAGVVLIVLSSSPLRPWRYLRDKNCTLTMDAAKAIAPEAALAKRNNSLLLAIGVILCVLCWIPAAVLEGVSGSTITDYLSGSALFILVGIGVLLIVYSAQINEAYHRLLKGDHNTIVGDYTEKAAKPAYENRAVGVIMSVFWPTVACLYLIVSFATFAWNITWIIFPIAVVVQIILRRIYYR